MRYSRFAASIFAAVCICAGPAAAGMLTGYPQMDDRSLAVFWIIVSASKTLYLIWRYRSSTWVTAILMLIPTFIWLCILYTIAITVYSDLSSASRMVQLLGMGFGLGVLIDWPFVHSALNRRRNTGDPSFGAAVVMQAAIFIVLLGIFLISTHGLPAVEDSGGGGD